MGLPLWVPEAQRAPAIRGVGFGLCADRAAPYAGGGRPRRWLERRLVSCVAAQQGASIGE